MQVERTERARSMPRARGGQVASRMPTSLTVILILLSSMIASCERPTSRLLELRDVTRDENGRTLSVTGSGFPGGHAGEAELLGTLYQAGAAARPLRGTLRCHALSDELLRVSLQSDDAEALGHGLFEGRLEVRFPSNAGSSEVVGTLPNVRLRLESARNADLSQDLLLTRRARTFQQALGALEVESSTHGLVLTRVAEGSPLAKAGLRSGDRIERMDGAPIERARDLQPYDDRAQHTFELARRLGGEKATVVVERADQGPSRRGDLAAFAFGIALFAGALIPGSRRMRAPRQHEARVSGIALTGLSFLLCGLHGVALDVRWFLGVPMSIYLGVVGFGFAKRKVSGVEALNAVLTSSASTLALSGLVILSGSLTNAWAGPSELAAPSHWTLLAAPPAWLALFVLHAARPIALNVPHAAHLAQWLRWTIAASVVSLAAGSGTAPHGSADALASMPAALLLFAGKTALLSVLLQAQTLVVPRPILGALALGCPLAAWGFMALSPRQDLSLILGCLGLGLWISRLAMGVLEARTSPVRDPALAPFL